MCTRHVRAFSVHACMYVCGVCVAGARFGVHVFVRIWVLCVCVRVRMSMSVFSCPGCVFVSVPVCECAYVCENAALFAEHCTFWQLEVVIIF